MNVTTKYAPDIDITTRRCLDGVMEYTNRNLPAELIGKSVRIASGTVLTIVGVVPEDREWGDSARGFVWAIAPGSSKRRRVYPTQFVEVI